MISFLCFSVLSSDLSLVLPLPKIQDYDKPCLKQKAIETPPPHTHTHTHTHKPPAFRRLFSFRYMTVKVIQSCLTLCDPRDYTVHGILQAKILEWVAFPFSRGIFPIQGSNPGLPHCRWILSQLSHKRSPRILDWVAYPFSSRSS